MKRTLTTGLVLALLLGVMSTPAQARSVSRECRFGTGTRAMRQTIWCLTRKYPVPGGHREAVYIAHRESRFQHNAWNASSGACGIYQHLSRYWPGRYRQYVPDRLKPAPDNCRNGRTNIIVTVFMVRRGGWGPWA